MAEATQTNQTGPIEHPGEEKSNELRRRLSAAEPHTLRTYTPTLVVVDRSAGCFHWTPEGRKLADFSSGVLVANLGHNPVRWWRRVLDYLKLDALPETGQFCQAAPLNAYNAATPLEIEASERLLASLQREPGGSRCQQVLWAASGSEAIIKSLWTSLVRRPGEDIILATRGGFHGKKGLAGAVTGNEDDPERDDRVRFISFPTQECCNVEARRQPIDLSPYEAELDALVSEFGSRICCLITEPYLGGGGSYHPQVEYLQLLEHFCRQNDVIFILDEVQSNFGRTGPMYAFTRYGIEPDFVVLGKGLGNGVPVSAAVGRRDLFANLDYGIGSDTWSANSLASAAVLATLDEFESADVLDHAARLSQVVEEGLTRLTRHPTVEGVRGEGMVWGVECAAVGSRSADDVACACVEACYRGDDDGRAIHLLGPLAGRVLRVSPPLVMALDDARSYLDVMDRIFERLAAELA